MTTWNDVKKHAGDKYPRRMLTPESYKEGIWVCHTLTSRWFKLVAMDGDLVGGIDLRDQDVIVPWKECYHPYLPASAGR